MRALITGGYGFAARHLAKHLAECGDDVAVTYREQERGEITPGLDLPKTAQTFALDITDREQVLNLISVIRPDVIYHLAALTYVPDAEKDLHLAFDVNTHGTVNLLDAVDHHSKETKFLAVSTSEVYGEPRPSSLPLKETAELRPISAYGVSKAAAELLAHKYAKRNGLNVIIARPFSHFGPAQSPRFAVSSFAKQVAEIKLGKAEPIVRVGNLDVKRDYSDVSDIVRGYREAVLNGVNGEAYNFCSAESIEIGEVLQKLIKLSGVDVEVVEDETKVRRVDIADIYGNYDKAQKDFGWKPRIDRDAALDSLLAYWLETCAG